MPDERRHISTERLGRYGESLEHFGLMRVVMVLMRAVVSNVDSPASL